MKNINFIYLFFCSGMTVSIALQNLTVKTTVCLLLTLCNESKRAAKPVDFARHNFQPLPELTIHIFKRRKHCVQAKSISTQPDTSFGFTAIETDGKCSTGLKAVIMVTRLWITENLLNCKTLKHLPFLLGLWHLQRFPTLLPLCKSMKNYNVIRSLSMTCVNERWLNLSNINTFHVSSSFLLYNVFYVNGNLLM